MFVYSIPAAFAAAFIPVGDTASARRVLLVSIVRLALLAVSIGALLTRVPIHLADVLWFILFALVAVMTTVFDFAWTEYLAVREATLSSVRNPDKSAHPKILAFAVALSGITLASLAGPWVTARDLAVEDLAIGHPAQRWSASLDASAILLSLVGIAGAVMFVTLAKRSPWWPTQWRLARAAWTAGPNRSLLMAEAASLEPAVES